MQRLLITASLLLAACASTAPKEPADPARGHMSSTDAKANPKRVTHPQSDLTCQDETPTGTLLDRRKCRSDIEREEGRKFARDMILDPSSRPREEKN